VPGFSARTRWAAGSLSSVRVGGVAQMTDPSLPLEQLAQVQAGTLRPADRTADYPSWSGAAGRGVSTADDLGTLPGYNFFMGYDPVNRVTIVAWGNLAPAANGSPPAEALVAVLLPLVYT